MKDTAAADNDTDETVNIDDANLAPMNNGSGHQSNKQIKNIPEATTATDETAVSSAASSVCQMLSSVVGTLAVQNYIQQLHQKDERIRELEEENRKLRLLFITQAEQLQQRNEQLLKDLSQHAELVMKLETDLANSRLNGIPTNLRDEIPVKKARRNGNVPSSTSASAVSKAPVPSSSFMPQQQQQSTATSTDELYAKLLQTVVEQQQNNQPFGNPIGDQDQGLLEIDEYAAAEQLVKMMAEEPSGLEESESDKVLQNILLALAQQKQPSDELDAPEKKPNISGQQKTGRNQTQLSQQQPPQMQIEQQMEVDEIDIDTAQLTRRVKEFLSKNEISQRAFGAHILKISASSVSEVLNKPKTKPWALLGRKQRQPYLKMLEFLNDPGAVERLRADEQHRCEMNSAQNDASSTKRKTTSSSSSHSNILSTMVSMTAPPTAVPVLDATTNKLRMGGAAPKKIPRLQQHRTLITAKQTEALHFVLAHEPRPNPQCIEQLATKLGLPFHTLTIWFRNHRRKTRQNTKKIKQEADDSDAETAKLFREELTELLRRNCDADSANANLDMDIIASGNGRGSVETASAESSLPPSPPQMNDCYGEDADANSLISGADGLYIDEDADEDDSESNIPGVKQIGSSDRGNSCGASSSASASSTSPPLGGGSQLDKIIARMHSRLAKTGRVE